MSDISAVELGRTATIHHAQPNARIGTKNASIQGLCLPFATLAMANLVTDSSTASRRRGSFPQESVTPSQGPSLFALHSVAHQEPSFSS